MQSKKFWAASFLLLVLVFLIPVEHKYDKLFRYYSLTLIPDGLLIPKNYDKKIYFYLSDLIAIALTAIALFWMKIPWRKFFLEKSSLMLSIVFAFSVLSIAASPFASYPITYIRLLQLLSPILLFCFVRTFFSDEKRIKWIFLTLGSAALLQTAIALIQYFEQGSLGLRVFGEQSLIPGDSPSILVSEGHRWLFDSLFHRIANTNFLLRGSGTMPHPNVLGGLLALSLLVSYSLICQLPKWRWFFALTLPFQFFALCITYSRSALFGWILGTLIWFGYARLKKMNVPYRFLSLNILFTAALSFALLYGQFQERGGVVNYNSYAQRSDTVRLVQQQIALQMIRANPLFGVGYNQYSIRSPDYFPEHISQQIAVTGTHNIYLILASESGLIALAAFLLFILFTLRSLVSAPASPTAASLLGIFFMFLFIGGCDFYPLLFQQGKLLFFLIAGLASSQMRKGIPIPATEQSWKMFDQISATYDRINRILSFGMDRGWRRQCSAYLPESAKILDLATGTGDQIIASFEGGRAASVVGIDLSTNMLEIAKQKLKQYAGKVELVTADAEHLPLPDSEFDAATFSFGIRNVPNPSRSLEEIFRVLKPKGKCVILEFSLPSKPIRPFYLFYLRYVLPKIGNFLSKDPAAYTYLNQTIETFPSGNKFTDLMEKAGFNILRVKPMALGAVSLYVGEKR